ncbi:hypothetical protein RUM44_008436 [Polyplax serrata]|uniref:RRM domain-containing protein n=1 Tax=Polyplax serrata TaxID=468196 RepID=A0ABR1BCF9_POLSC
MGDLELSLDDIIKKKLKKTDLKRNRNNTRNGKKPIRRISDPNNRVSKNAGGSAMGKKLRNPAKNARGQGARPAIADARNKLIQKQRQNITDAREKLCQIAKQTDARLRLMKMREIQRGPTTGMRSAQPRVLPEPSILQRTVQSRMNTSMYEDEMMDFTNNVGYLSRNFADKVAMDEEMYSYPFRARQDSSLLYRTVENDMTHSRLYEDDKYNWSKPLMSGIDDYVEIPTSRLTSRVLKGIGRSDDIRGATQSWDFDETPIVITKKLKPQETVGILKRVANTGMVSGQPVKIIKESSPQAKPVRTLSERFCQEGNLSAQKINLLKAKLEASQKNNKFLPEEAQVGHRIVVSNLVPTVTHDDVKELFEDIGELLSSKVVRPGTAEVIYKLHKDAVRAVDVYHNRQLDGQPMKCLLVNNRSTLAMASKSFKGAAQQKLSKTVVEVDMTAFRKALHKKSTS